jgi:hypothetical protein
MLCAAALGLTSFITLDVARVAVFPLPLTFMTELSGFGHSPGPGSYVYLNVTPVFIGPCRLRLFWNEECTETYNDGLGTYTRSAPISRSLARRLPDHFWIDPLRLLIMFAWSAVVFAGWMGWRRFRYQPGRCRACGYDLAGPVRDRCARSAAECRSLNVIWRSTFSSGRS